MKINIAMVLTKTRRDPALRDRPTEDTIVDNHGRAILDL